MRDAQGNRAGHLEAWALAGADERRSGAEVAALTGTIPRSLARTRVAAWTLYPSTCAHSLPGNMATAARTFSPTYRLRPDAPCCLPRFRPYLPYTLGLGRSSLAITRAARRDH